MLNSFKINRSTETQKNAKSLSKDTCTAKLTSESQTSSSTRDPGSGTGHCEICHARELRANLTLRRFYLTAWLRRWAGWLSGCSHLKSASQTLSVHGSWNWRIAGTDCKTSPRHLVRFSSEKAEKQSLHYSWLHAQQTRGIRKWPNLQTGVILRIGKKSNIHNQTFFRLKKLQKQWNAAVENHLCVSVVTNPDTSVQIFMNNTPWSLYDKFESHASC